MHSVSFKTLVTCCLVTVLTTAISSGQDDGSFVLGDRIVSDVNRGSQWGPEVSADGLELYFGSTRTGSGDLYVARREVVGDPWASVEPLSELNSNTREAAPSISTDGREIYFVSDRTGRREIFVSTRPDASGPFDAPWPLSLNVPGQLVGPEISADGLQLYFHVRNNGPVNIWVAWREDPEDSFESFRRLTELETGCAQIQPSLSSGGKTLFWSDDLCNRLWTASRPEVWDDNLEPAPFGDPRRLDVPASGGAPSISSSWPEAGAELFFVQGDQIRVATWEVPATFIRGDCSGDGEVNLSDAVCILEGLFAGGPGASCRAAANVDADDTVNLADATFLLHHLFGGGTAPPSPFPECGISELGVHELDCEAACVR